MSALWWLPVGLGAVGAVALAGVHARLQREVEALADHLRVVRLQRPPTSERPPILP